MKNSICNAGLRSVYNIPIYLPKILQIGTKANKSLRSLISADKDNYLLQVSKSKETCKVRMVSIEIGRL